MAVKLKCSFCETKFSWDFAALGWPDHCPKCKEFIGTDRADDDIVMPSIRHARTKIIDSTYTQMEKGSEFRAQAAAELTGAPVSEMSSLKITDMKTGMREGDIAVKEPVNDVTIRMQQMRDRGLPIGFGGGGLDYSQAVPQGPHPNVGARMRVALQNNHPDMVRHHAVGTNERGQPAIPSTDVVSTRDANETYQPGYRRRA
jgi:hypothetical protein